MRILSYIFGLCFCILLSASELAYAQVPEDNVLDGVIQQYKDTAAIWSETLTQLATNLFILLATIELAYSGIRLALEGADLDEWLSEFVHRIMLFSLFLFLLMNGGFAHEIVTSFREAAGAVPGTSGGFSPTNILDLGIEISGKVLGEVNFWTNASESLGLIITALIIVVAFALMAAILILALVEMYILINAGIFLLGFGGSRFTQDFALKFMSYVVSVGAKLFVLQLVIGLGYTMMSDFIAKFNSGANAQVLVMIGVAITFLALTKTVPDMVQSMIAGVAVGNSGGLFSAARQTYSAGAAAAGTAGDNAARAYASVSALKEAAKYAEVQGQGGPLGTAKAFSGAVGNSVADKVRGVPGSKSGSTMGDAYDFLRKERANFQAARSEELRPGEKEYISSVPKQNELDSKE